MLAALFVLKLGNILFPTLHASVSLSGTEIIQFIYAKWLWSLTLHLLFKPAENSSTITFVAVYLFFLAIGIFLFKHASVVNVWLFVGIICCAFMESIQWTLFLFRVIIIVK